MALWNAGLDYDHGTGHGVGHYLSVHEGPQNISKRPVATPLRAGMVCLNEPGYYKAGEYGIRIENLIAVKPPEEIPGGERKMLSFETLTLAPIDLALVEPGLLARARLAERLSCPRARRARPAHRRRDPSLAYRSDARDMTGPLPPRSRHHRRPRLGGGRENLHAPRLPLDAARPPRRQGHRQSLRDVPGLLRGLLGIVDPAEAKGRLGGLVAARGEGGIGMAFGADDADEPRQPSRTKAWRWNRHRTSRARSTSTGSARLCASAT